MAQISIYSPMHSSLKTIPATVAAILATTISFATAAPEDEKEARPTPPREAGAENAPSPRADRPERGPERPEGRREEDGQKRPTPPRDRPAPPQKSPESPREAGQPDRGSRPEPARSPEERLRHLREAGEHLALAGFPEEARHVRELIERMEQEHRARNGGGEHNDDLSRQVDELRKHVEMLHQEVARLKENAQGPSPRRE